MVQAHGYNALSFREVAKAVDVKSASVHYHFPTKGDLGAALARQYTEEGIAYLNVLRDEMRDLPTLLQRYTDIFRAALANDNRMCLCGIMAAEREDLPQGVRAEVDAFTDANVRWLAEVLRPTISPGKEASVECRALSIFAAIEGAQLVARGRGDIGMFDRILDGYRATGLLP
jgi:TetR/AcrR family transcriptional repressor of nem operon